MMTGIHDLGGRPGFGKIERSPGEPVFARRWQRELFGIVCQLVGFGWTSIDKLRHAIERLDPEVYLSAGYYGRWLLAIERLMIERKVLGPSEVDAKLAGRAVPIRVCARPAPPRVGFVRAVANPPRFRVGDSVVTRVVSHAGHTRLPCYAMGRRGTVARVYPACVYPDSHAHDRGEDPQHLYNVQFDARELWGRDAEPGVIHHLDLFEPYIEAR
jgi:nitrile hydratase subunit beta